MTSCFDKIKGGFAMGGALGLGVGSFLAPIASWRAGLRGRPLLRNTAQQMLTFGIQTCEYVNAVCLGILFGMFLAVGTGIRCEAQSQQSLEQHKKVAPSSTP
eukprot:gene3999-6449_t